MCRVPAVVMLKKRVTIALGFDGGGVWIGDREVSESRAPTSVQVSSVVAKRVSQILGHPCGQRKEKHETEQIINCQRKKRK